MATQFNPAALEAMVHYITRMYSSEPEKLGSTRLHKILWNAEVRSVRKTGYPIAGESFIKRQFGPCAEHLDAVVQDLVRMQRLTVVEPDDDYRVRRYIGKGEPRRDVLTSEQWRILEDTMRFVVENHSATSISERSHGDLWEATELYQPMPVDLEVLRFVHPSKKIAGEIERHLLTQ